MLPPLLPSESSFHSIAASHDLEMSGVEVAGLALAILPLLALALQHYDDCLSPFSRYRRFVKEAEAYCREIDVQRTIFRNECRNLLGGSTDHDTAISMLKSASRREWNDDELEERIVQRLDESFEACTTIIGMVVERLGNVHAESSAFRSVVEDEIKVQKVHFRLW